MLWCTHPHTIVTLRSNKLVSFAGKWIGCATFHCILRHAVQAGHRNARHARGQHPTQGKGIV